MKRILIPAILIFLGHTTFAQLGGTYIIGGQPADFSSLSVALDKLMAEGSNDTVVLNFAKGEYELGSLEIKSSQIGAYPIIIQSESGNPLDVTLRVNSIKGINNLTFRAISFLRSDQAVLFSNLNHLCLDHCVFRGPSRDQTPGNGRQSAIHPKQSTSTLGDIAVSSTGYEGKAERQGTNGIPEILPETPNSDQLGPEDDASSAFRFEGCSWVIVENNNFYSIMIYDKFDSLVFRNNTTHTYIYFRRSKDTRLYSNSFLSKVDIDDCNRMQYYDNTSTYRTYWYDCSDMEVHHNAYKYYGPNFLKCNGMNFNNNLVDWSFGISSSKGVILSKNVFTGKELHIGSSDNLTVCHCEFHGYSRIIDCDNSRIYSNLFYDDVDVRGRPMEIMFNNFAHNKLLWGDKQYNTSLLTVKYNNLPGGASLPSTSTIAYNNYDSLVNYLDQHPYNYDPEYIHDTNIRAQSPLLLAKAQPVSYIIYDIDSIPRETRPAIGANEILIPSLSAFDSTILICGNPITFRLDMDSIAGIHWAPSEGLDDSSLLHPTASPGSTIRYFLLDSTEQILDSVLIIVEPFITHNLMDISMLCYHSVFTGGNFNPSATYSWIPPNGLSDPHIHNPLAKPDTTTLYLQQISIPGCGIYSEDVLIAVDPLPIAYAYKEPGDPEVEFYSFSSCADSFFWDFGDGHTSSLEDPVHIYDSNGYYSVVLIVFNSYGSDTATLMVEIIGVGVEEMPAQNTALQINPNPARETIWLELGKLSLSGSARVSILDLTGREKKHFTIPVHSNRIEVSIQELSSGLYLLKVITGDGKTYAKKLVVE